MCVNLLNNVFNLREVIPTLPTENQPRLLHGSPSAFPLFLFFFFKNISQPFCFFKFIYLFIFGCVGSSLLRAGFL